MKTKSLLLLGCTVLLGAIPFTAAHAAAPAGVAATVSAAYGQADCDGCGASSDAWNIGGAAAFGFGGAFGAEIDASYTNIDPTDIFGLAGSLFWAPAFGRAGINVSYQSFQEDLFGTGFTIDISGLTYGAFGEFYLGQFLTIGAKAGGLSVNLDDGTVSDSQNGAYAAAAVTGYITPNFALQGDVMFTGVSDFIGSGQDVDNTIFGVGAEFLVSQMVPISVFGKFTFGSVDVAGQSLDTNKWIVGARFYIGATGPTLVDRHRNGTLGWIGATEATSFLLP